MEMIAQIPVARPKVRPLRKSHFRFFVIQVFESTDSLYREDDER